MRSNTEASPIPDGIFYTPNTESNPLVISDDSKDDYDHPLLVVRPLEPSDFEAAWDLPDLHTEQIDDNNEANSSSSTNGDNSTTKYSSDGGFVVNDEVQNVFLHNTDPDYAPGSVSSSDRSSKISDDKSADVDDEEPPAKMQRRGSAKF